MAQATAQQATVEAETNVSSIALRITQKRAAFEVAKESLANAVELERELDAEAKALADDQNAIETAKQAAQGKAVDTIAKGMIEGFFTKDEATALYGDAYGYKPKKDGTPGKTPAGTGETLRKRSVLLAEAANIAAGAVGELPKWAEGKDVEDIAETVIAWDAGELSCWQAYKDLSAKEKRAPTPLHFDEKKLLSIISALRDDVTRQSIKDSSLAAVYDELVATWNA
jgi:hypothetical protein